MPPPFSSTTTEAAACFFDVTSAALATAQLVSVFERSTGGFCALPLSTQAMTHGACVALNFIGACALGIAFLQLRLSLYDTENNARSKLAFGRRLVVVGAFTLLHAFGHAVLVVVGDKGSFAAALLERSAAARYALSLLLLLPGPVVGVALSGVDGLIATFLYGMGSAAFSKSVRVDTAFPLVSAWILAWYAYPRVWAMLLPAKTRRRQERGRSPFSPNRTATSEDESALVTSACVAIAAAAAAADTFACGQAWRAAGGHMAHDALVLGASVAFVVMG